MATMSDAPGSFVDPLRGKRVTVGVTGSIAAYKAVELVRLLQLAGAEVEVILSEAATEFVGAATFEGLLGRRVHQEMFTPAGGELHVELGRRSEAIVVAPATADTLARMAAGRASDLLTATVLSARCPIWVAPAMHPNMWSHPATGRHVATLQRDGVTFLGPVFGAVASGDEGVGRLLEPALILQALREGLTSRAALTGVHVVVTAGPTEEPIDAVRFLSNRSSGKMGYAIARALVGRGARVTLLSGPVAAAAPSGCEVRRVQTALELEEALLLVLGPGLTGAQAVVMAAAVADVRPRRAAPDKLEKAQLSELELEANPDILAGLGARRSGPWPLLIGFALETGADPHVLARARLKRERKRVDLVVANAAGESLGLETNRVFLVTAGGAQSLPTQSKAEVAAQIADWLQSELQVRTDEAARGSRGEAQQP
jgi:phosphopantothenoylcysteine decarboxylase/phosphopantothenate--cysteine ligase